MSFAWHQVRDHLMQTSSTLRFQPSYDALRRAEDLLAPFRDPAAMLDALHRGAGGRDQKNLILTTLVQAAQSNAPAADCALTLMLLALWPGLDAIRRRSLCRRLGTPDEITSDVLSRATQTIGRLDLRRVSRIAATTLGNVERDMIRERRREMAQQNLVSDIDPDDIAADEAHDPVCRHRRLNAEVRRLIGADARLFIRVAVEGFSQAEAAVEIGLSEAATRKRYQRATRRLRDVLKKSPEPLSRSGDAAGFWNVNAPKRSTPIEGSVA